MSWISRLLRAVAPARDDRAVDAELRAHLDLEAEELTRQGVPPAEAYRRARVAFGSIEKARAESRQTRRLNLELIRDTRLAARDLAKNPGYAIACVLTLALVIAANTAIFSAVYAVLLKPTAIQRPDRLVLAWETERKSRGIVELSYRNVEDWAAQATSLSHVAAVGSSTWPVILDRPGESVRLSSAGVTVSFFDTVGTPTEVGRLFNERDDVPGAPRVAILSHATWVRRFGADPDVIGMTVHLGQPHTVVGVMPQGFDFPRGTEVWLPVVPILRSGGDGQIAAPLEAIGVLLAVGRLHDGATADMARDELNLIAERIGQDNSRIRFGEAVVVTPFLDYHIGPVRHALWALFAAVGVLLAVGCINVSALMLARATRKRRETAIQLALGATVARVRRRWALEAILLSGVGGCLGLLASTGMAQGVVALAPADIPRVSEAAVNLPVAAFSLLAVLATALLCAVQPLRQLRKVDLCEALGDGGRATLGRHAHRTRSALLIAQVALTVALLVAAGLVLRSFGNLRAIDLGFEPANVLTMNVAFRGPSPPANARVDDLLARVSALPRIQEAGAVFLRPLALGPIGQDTWVLLEGQQPPADGSRINPTLNYQVATPGYFGAMRIPLLRGRLFSGRDDHRAPAVALVGEGTARALWPGQEAVGKRILMPGHAPDGGPDRWRTVIGVVGDVRYRGIDDVRLDVYDAAMQARSAADNLVVRVSGDPLDALVAIQAEARSVDPRVVIDRVTTMEAIVSRAVAPWRFSAWMFTLFAIVAFALATVGLVSVAALDVTDRRREFALRLAVGAERRDIRRVVLRRALWRVAPGLALGLLAALVGTRALESILFNVQPLDPPTYAAVSALVIATVLVASWWPAEQASAANPLALLRRD